MYKGIEQISDYESARKDIKIDRKRRWNLKIRSIFGGDGGIRTHGTSEGTTDFESVPLWPLRYVSIYVNSHSRG